jgi:UDP-N-acetylmuramoyl-tripeptide--D-alanyl-D-alanine ligase
VDVEFSRWRGDEIPLPGGGILVNDCWNANPTSMRAALEDLADRAEGRRTVAVLGGMAELGADSAAYHLEIGALVTALGIDVLIAVGELGRHYADMTEDTIVTARAADAREAAQLARGTVEPGDVVLVKGSRAFGLEAVAEALAEVPV